VRKKFFRQIPGLLLLALFLPGSTEMLGPLVRETLLDQNPDWRPIVAAYEPKPDAVEKLRAFADPVRIEVYLGTWCPDSRAHVSEFFKVLDRAGNPRLQAIYTAVPRDRSRRPPYYAGRAIERLPSFLIFIGGREKGRIVETPRRSVEEDLVEILGK
jgi:thiol-disulfide isomerase/thioredoxin